ncbi:MAG TPA: PaaI family thioesterase [Acidimicrobiia bacterium]|nr:PaaI family thioesterase [Acidimicrobiia bacterium]
MTERAEQFPPLAPEVRARWANFAQWETVFFPQFLGVVVEELRVDYARMRLPFRAEFLQPAGVVHGGAIATLVDTVVVPAVGSAYDGPRQLFTIDMQLRYLAPIGPEDAIAEGWITRRGRSIVYCDAEVRAASGVVAATATLVYKVSSRPLAVE